MPEALFAGPQLLQRTRYIKVGSMEQLAWLKGEKSYLAKAAVG
jgi:hypothetical protein